MTVKLKILTADRTVYTDDIDVLIAPGMSGQLGVLPHHVPLISILKPGQLTIKRQAKELDFAVGGGFLEITKDDITVLADSVERSEDIDVARAEAAKARAEERLQSKAPELDRLSEEAALQRAMARLEVASKAKTRS